MALVIHTSRLVLRDLEHADSQQLAWAIGADVQKYMGPMALTKESELEPWVIEAMRTSTEEPRVDFDLAIVHRQSNQLIGLVALHIDEQGGSEGWIAYAIAPAYRGQKFATEAVQALIQYAFETLRLSRITARVHPDNISSKKLLERIGMVCEKTESDRLSYSLEKAPAR